MRTTITGHADAGGRIRAFDVQLVMDNGAYNMTGPFVMTVGFRALGGMYRPDAVRWDGRLVDTAVMPAGRCAGTGICRSRSRRSARRNARR